MLAKAALKAHLPIVCASSNSTALMVTLKMFINLMKISDTLEFAIIGVVILVGVVADELLKKAVAHRQASKS